MTEQPLTVGTAGHVDHGKTALVEALTGTRTDRLPEERRRGLSIELGFAELDLGERRLSLIDVPGHERFLRTMIAGAGGVGLYLMVIAADDGVMPQTREHATVLAALGVESGVIALSKCDRAGPAERAATAAAARELLPQAPVVEVSAVTRAGIGSLRQALTEAAARLDGKARAGSEGEVLLHVDRAFTIRGHGTVVTGTLLDGIVARGDLLNLLPGREEARVRGIQVHNEDVDRAHAGQRVALNLTLAGGRRPSRGDAIVARPASVFETYRLDVELLGEASVAPAGRVHVHLGTRRARARLIPLGGGFAQLRLEAPLFARGGDRVVLRGLAPLRVIGGAVIVDPLPARHGPGGAEERLRLLAEGEPGDLLRAALAERGSLPRRALRLGGEPALAGALHRFPRARWQAALNELLAAGEASERGDAIGPPPPSAEPDPPPPRRTHPLGSPVLAELRAAPFAPPPPAVLAATLGADEGEVAAALTALVQSGDAVRAAPKVFFAAECLEAAERRALDLIERRGAVTIAEVRDELAISRKYAQALLEHLDARATYRDGDVHRLRPNRARER